MPKYVYNKRIGLIGGLIFIGLTVVTGIYVYLVMLKQPDYVLKLQLLAQKRVRLIEQNIHEGVTDTQSDIISTSLIQNLQELNIDPDNTEIRDHQKHLLASKLVEANFTGIYYL